MRIMLTRTVNNDVADSARFAKDVLNALKRFFHCDWGTVDDEDKKANDDALKSGDRILAAYNTVKGKIWVIADAEYNGKRVATVLYPSEY